MNTSENYPTLALILLLTVVAYLFPSWSIILVVFSIFAATYYYLVFVFKLVIGLIYVNTDTIQSTTINDVRFMILLFMAWTTATTVMFMTGTSTLIIGFLIPWVSFIFLSAVVRTLVYFGFMEFRDK